MPGKLINLGLQIVTDELEEAGKNDSVPFDWNVIGLDKSRPTLTRINGKSMLEPNFEQVRRKIDAISKG